MADEKPILFYDGECGLCARGVQWILRHERRDALRFAPLQGETYRALNIPGKPTDMSTMVLLDDGRLFTRSDSWVRVLRLVGGVWSGVGTVVGWAPRGLRDRAYAWVARRRHAWFGRAEACAVPSPAQRARFLA